MLDRAHVFTSSALHDEKLIALGKLSAGLAHELNNPAAAIERGAALLEDYLKEAERATHTLSAARLTDAQLDAIDTVRACCSATPAGVLSPIQQAEREDAIAVWLTDHRLNAAMAAPLADTAVTLDALDRVADAVDGPRLDAALQWVAAVCSVHGLASVIQEAATRISGLVQAIKGFTHMDQAAVAEPVDLAVSIGNTVAVLRSKALSKSIAVAVHLEPGLPLVRGIVGELNQIWANLIDNALDAAPDSGQVEVTATRKHQGVLVGVVDNGPGIPDGVHERLFEPFFTTKPVGKGTGLGLDIVRRLVSHNDAAIEVESRPGRTEFRVFLPLADAEGAGTAR
jgi:signal transduction histidine kinase